MKAMAQVSMQNTQLNSPNKHVMALITFLALVPLVYFIPDLIAPFLPEGKLLKVTAALAITVPFISYLVLPTAAKVLMRRSA